LACALLCLAGTALPARAGECRALIVSGDPGHEPNAAKRFTDWTDRWAALLKDKYGFKAENIRVLRGSMREGPDAATHENVLAAMAGLVRDSKDGDQDLVVLLGHGYDAQNIGRFCLPGKDLSDVEAARALEKVRAKQFILINTAPASASWAKAFSMKDRVIIVASATEGLRSQTYFNEFLLRALLPGNVNLLEAFNRAALQTIRWYQNQFVEHEGTTVHGKEFQEIYKALYPDKPMSAGSAEPQAANNDMRDMAGWLGRRVLAEAAGLEDNGDGVPSSVYEDGKDPKPLPSKAGDGLLARTIILGKP
jgi:hypothetical protein